jgi:hypothetical protein
MALFIDITSAYGLPRPQLLILQHEEVNGENYGNDTVTRSQLL